MRLLLDEHLSQVVAQQLRARDRDVVAVVERPDLRATPDAAIFDLAVEELRTLVTYDLGFRSLARQRLEEGLHHFGLVLIAPARIPQGERQFGRLISSLDALLSAMPSDQALVDREWWLE